MVLNRVMKRLLLIAGLVLVGLWVAAVVAVFIPRCEYGTVAQASEVPFMGEFLGELKLDGEVRYSYRQDHSSSSVAVVFSGPM